MHSFAVFLAVAFKSVFPGILLPEALPFVPSPLAYASAALSSVVFSSVYLASAVLFLKPFFNFLSLADILHLLEHVLYQ